MNNKKIQKHFELPHQETIVGINTIQTKPFDYQKIETMSNNKQSSVEWLYIELTAILCDVEVNPVKAIAIFDRLKQAKAMHKEEIIDATCLDHYINEDDREIGEQYYEQTFGGNNEQQ